MALTDAQIKALRPGPERKRIHDGGNLSLEVAATGRKTFRLAYRHSGKQRTIWIGAYPATRLAEARIAAAEAKRLLRQGIDPKDREVARRALKADPVRLWRNVVQRYVDLRRAEGAAPKTLHLMQTQFDLTMPDLGDRDIGTITTPDILAVVRPIEARGIIETARRVRSRCSQVFRFAIAEGIAERDPAAAATSAMRTSRTTSLAALTDPEEVGALMCAIQGYLGGYPEARWGLLLSAYLFPRNAELRGMRWDEIDVKGAVWTIPAHRMKMTREHIVPLPRQVLALLEEIRSWNGHKPLVLASPNNPAAEISPTLLGRTLNLLGTCSTASARPPPRRSTPSATPPTGSRGNWRTSRATRSGQPTTGRNTWREGPR